MQENPAEQTGPSTAGWRFDNGRAEPVVPAPDTPTKGFTHVAMTAPDDDAQALADLLADVKAWRRTDAQWTEIDVHLERLRAAVDAGLADAVSDIENELILAGPKRNARELTAEDRPASDETCQRADAVAALLRRP